MKSIRNIVLLLCSHLLVALLVVSVSSWWHARELAEQTRQNNAMLSHVMLISRHAAVVDMQRLHAYPEGYRDALLLYSNVLDQTRQIKAPIFSEKAYATDKALTFERLSRVERELGNPEQAERYFAKAQEFCAKTGWQDCSRENLTKISRQLEQFNLFDPQGT